MIATAEKSLRELQHFFGLAVVCFYRPVQHLLLHVVAVDAALPQVDAAGEAHGRPLGVGPLVRESTVGALVGAARAARLK